MTRLPILIIIITLLICFRESAQARPVMADLSLRKIEIDSGFVGTEILLFGARNDAGDILVVIRGPETPYVVRKKERVAGVWVNKKQITLDGGYGYYNLASSRPIEDMSNHRLLKNLGIGTEHIAFFARGKHDEKEEFTKALVKHKKETNLYNTITQQVNFIGETLFRSIIQFPENIPRGTYTAEVYLFSDNQLVGFQSTPLMVYKTGFDAFVFDLAYKNPIIYGIVSVLLALLAGWIAGIIFKRVV